MARKPQEHFMFANARPTRPGSARGSRNKVAQVPLPAPTPDPKGLVLDLKDVVHAAELTAIKTAKSFTRWAIPVGSVTARHSRP